MRLINNIDINWRVWYPEPEEVPVGDYWWKGVSFDIALQDGWDKEWLDGNQDQLVG